MNSAAIQFVKSGFRTAGLRGFNMHCWHPSCPTGNGLATWTDVLNRPELRIRPKDHIRILKNLTPILMLDGRQHTIAADVINSAPFKRVLDACPCLFTQISKQVTPKAVVHLCEITLGEPITSSNVFEAFIVQHPSNTTSTYAYPPVVSGASGGEIMEQLCSEVLANHGVPHMDLDADGWPDWNAKRHLSLNSGKMFPLKLYGDILVPAAPHNLMISVKSEAARERFVVSGNRLESIGFGFFNDASEFWTNNRMNLLKRWGFSAIYMPAATHKVLMDRLRERDAENHAININGRPLFRPLEDFGEDIARIAGKLSISL